MPVLARTRLTVADQYTASLTFTGFFARSCTITVANNPVYVQFAPVDPARGLRAAAFDFDGTEIDLLNGIWGVGPRDYPGGIAGIKFRNLTPGAAALVSFAAS